MNNLVLQCAHLKIKTSRGKKKLLQSTSFTTLSSSGEAAEDKGQKFELFLLKDSSKKKSKTKETFETTAISTGSTDTLRFTIRKTWEASDQANKKIASSKLFLLHLLIHTCTTQKDSINIYLVRTSPVISLLQFIFQQTFWCFFCFSIIDSFFADSCFPVCLSLCPSASFKLVGCQVGGPSATWPQNKWQPRPLRGFFVGLLSSTWVFALKATIWVLNV